MSSSVTICLPTGVETGWGNCGRALIHEFVNITDCEIYTDIDGTPIQRRAVITNVRNETFRPGRRCELWAPLRIGYGFIEANVKMRRYVLNAKNYWAHICCGSTWMHEQLVEAGITNCSTVIQGVSHSLFHPEPRTVQNDHFVIFSGGKYEFRKGQDIVIRAVAHMMSLYRDVYLKCAWGNKWQFSVDTMRSSKLIQHPVGTDWRAAILKSMYDCKIDISRCEVLPIISQAEMAAIYHSSDIGLFPNRCEAGTNLIAMEAMSCGLPCILSNNSGHGDIVHACTELAIHSHAPLSIFADDGQQIAEWREPSLDETIATLEMAYFQRDTLHDFGQRAALAMEAFTWSRTATGLLDAIPN